MMKILKGLNLENGIDVYRRVELFLDFWYRGVWSLDGISNNYFVGFLDILC